MDIKNSTKLRLIAAFAFLMIGNLIWAQSQTPLDIALRHIEENAEKWGLAKEDVSDMLLTDSHISTISGVAHMYFKQRHQGVEVENAILNLSVSADGEVLFVGKRAIPNINTKANSSVPAIDAQQAVVSTLSHLELPAVNTFTVKETRSAQEIIFEKGKFANREVPVTLVYLATEDGQVKLTWKVAIDPTNDFNYWYSFVDANTGEVLKKHNLVIECAPTNLSNQHKHSHACTDHIHAQDMAKHQTVKEALTQSASVVTNSYRVFPIPVESPIHGTHQLVTNPENAAASPIGWHDDGNTQWTTTRGNNVFAYLDTDGNGAPDGPTPDGGATLDFDFPYDETLEPVDMQEAAQVNLFYMNNIMHDFSYHYGFTEGAGNFQDNNFGNGGNGNDHVEARAQAAGLNNANFGTPPDGSSGTMNMFVWDQDNGSSLLYVEAPGSVEGPYNAVAAAFGPDLTTDPITAEVVIVNDGIFDPYTTDGCEEDYVNGSELENKIALIDRGGCFFETKVVNAEAYGALAVIVCNFEDDPITMGAVPDVDDPGIPSVMIGNSDCQLIRQFAGNGLEATLQLPSTSSVQFVDGDYDNGIIAHEFGHGISNRLTAGGSNVGCLGNAEQMGEGWSDFMSLVTTVEPGDLGTDPRGIGNYAVRLPVDGGGIRDYPYSTDMGVNPITYEDLPGQAVPHGVGFVWCSMVFDLYWAMVDVYGWDADLYTGTGGNNMAIQLVFEGMKIQPCNPGFVDGRDAILAADEALFDGEHKCLIWEVFARRGLGWYADQGDSNSAGDGHADFEPFPLCVEELKMSKEVTPLITAGDDIDVSLEVINHKPETLTGVTVTDVLETGQTYIAGSANISDVSVNGNMVSFNIGDMEYEDEVIITYKVATDPGIFSIQQWFDPAEVADNWFQLPVTNTNFWSLSDANPYEGTNSWVVQDLPEESHQILFTPNTLELTGNRPTLRFWHSYNTEAALDGGLIELSTDGGSIYQNLSDKMIRGAYPGAIAYGTFVVPNLDAFSGDSEGYVSTYVDLSDYNGDDVNLRFNFASDDSGTAVGGGWFVDNIELMDLKNYNSETCATSDQGDEVCLFAEEEGTIIESQIGTYTTSPNPNVNVGIYPNPADEVINLTIGSKVAQDVNISIMTVDGKEVMSRSVSVDNMVQTFTLDVADYAHGFYFVKVAANDEVTVEKVIIN